MPVEAVQQLLDRTPILVHYRPEAVGQAMQQLSSALSIKYSTVAFMGRKQPQLLMQPATQTLKSAEQLAAAVGVPVQAVITASMTVPSLLVRRLPGILKRLQGLVSWFDVTPASALQMVAAAPELLTDSGAGLQRRLEALRSIFQLKPVSAQRLAAALPSVLFVSPRILNNKLKVLMAILHKDRRAIGLIVYKTPQLLRSNLEQVRINYQLLPVLLQRKESFVFAMTAHRPMQMDDSGDFTSGHASGGFPRTHTTAARRRAAMSTSRFKGVCYNKKCKRWQASTNAYGKYLYLGLFSSETAAAQVYDLASLKIRGRNSSTNFPAQQYLDESGQLPADEHLDGVIAQLKSEAAAQLLADVQDDPMWQSCEPGSNPLEKVALIRQRVGSRRMAGLEQQLMEVLAPEGGVPTVDPAAAGMAMDRDDQVHAGAVALCSYDRPDDSTQQLGPLEGHELATMMPLADLNVPTIQQLLQLDNQDPTAAAPDGGLSGSSSSMLLAQQLVFDNDWLSAPDLPQSAPPANPLPDLLQADASAAPAGVPACMQQDPTQKPQQSRQHQEQSPFAAALLFDQHVAGSELVVPAGLAEPPVPAGVQAPRSASPGLAKVGSCSSMLGNAGGEHCTVAAQVAAGNPFSSDGNISCVSISWLQTHLPPHCQLQQVVNHSGGLCGMLYAQPSPAVPSGVLWGAAVWDGNSFRYSQLYGSAAEAVNLCGSVLRLVASCKEQDN
eukprot:gene8690-8871_t